MIKQIDKNIVHVAVGVIINPQNEVLISHRAAHQHQGGLWEFPGGKIELNESVEQALKRELKEELGIDILDSEFLIQIPHEYDDIQVYLDVYKVTSFSGEAIGCEQQEIKWVPLNPDSKQKQLREYDFPAANKAIITALNLATEYAITGSFEADEDALRRITIMLENGIRFIQLRAKKLSSSEYINLARQVQTLCNKFNATLILNGQAELLSEVAAHGLQVTSQGIQELSIRPVDDNKLLGVSVHNRSELESAIKLGANFVMISPVNATASHPDTIPLGWDEFEAMVDLSPVPVFALGGISRDDKAKAQSCGAHGIAAIGSFWPK